MELTTVVRLLLSPAFLLGAGLVYLVDRITSGWRHFQRLTRDLPGPPPEPLFGQLHLFYSTKSFQDVNHYILRSFDKYGGVFKLWMGHELWICIADNELAKDVSEFWSSYVSVPSYNFYGYAKDITYVKKTACPFRVKMYETNPEPTVHLDRVEQATTDLVEELKAKAGPGTLSHTDLKLAIQDCMKRCLKDIDWKLDIRQEYKNKIYFPFQDRIDRFLMKLNVKIQKVLHKNSQTFKGMKGNNPVPAEDFLKICTWLFETHDKEAPSKECMLFTRDLNINITEGPESHLSGEVSEHFAAQLSECVEKSAVLLVNLLEDVAAHPEVLSQLRAEADRVWGSATVPTLSAERKLSYTEMVIKEALRLYSPPGFFLRAGKDFTRDNMVVPQGCLTYISAEHIHSNFEFYERATSFYPEHFSYERQKTAPSGIFFPLPLEIPFCTDNRLVMKLMKMILSSLVRHFSLETKTHPDSIQHDFFRLNENLKTISLTSKPL